MIKAPFFVFLLRGEGGGILAVHPFLEGSKIFSAAKIDPEGIGIQGRFAAQPDSETIARSRSLLDSALNAGVKRHARERGFALRIAIVSGVFVFVYLFFSIVVRDPIPFVDEFFLGGIGVFFAYSYLSRRASSTPEALAFTTTLRRALGSAYYSDSRIARLAEEWMDEARSIVASGAASVEAWLAVEPESLGEADRIELTALTDSIALEIGHPGLFGPESPDELEARARRLMPRIAKAGKAGRRQAQLAAVLLKGRRNLERRDSP